MVEDRSVLKGATNMETDWWGVAVEHMSHNDYYGIMIFFVTCMCIQAN